METKSLTIIRPHDTFYHPNKGKYIVKSIQVPEVEEYIIKLVKDEDENVIVANTKNNEHQIKLATILLAKNWDRSTIGPVDLSISAEDLFRGEWVYNGHESFLK